MAAVTGGLELGGCAHLEREVTGRPPAPLPADLLRALRPPSRGREFRLERVAEECAFVRYLFRFEVVEDDPGGPREVRGDYYRPRSSGDGPFPLVILSPILAGPVDDYRASRYFARRLAGRGMAAFFLHQQEVVLEPGRCARDLERRLEANVRDNIRALDLLLGEEPVDGARLGSLGISMGAIKNVALVAAEPRLRGNVLCLAGGDVPAILVASREPLVRRYLESRRERDGLRAAEVAEEFRRDFRCDPLRLAASVANDRVLLLLARFDDKVPFATGKLLREALGRPETRIVPLGHYTAMVAAPWAASVALEWLAGRFGASSQEAQEGPAATPPGKPSVGTRAARGHPDNPEEGRRARHLEEAPRLPPLPRREEARG